MPQERFKYFLWVVSLSSLLGLAGFFAPLNGCAEEFYECAGVIQSQPCEPRSSEQRFIDMDREPSKDAPAHAMQEPDTPKPAVRIPERQPTKPAASLLPEPSLKWSVSAKDRFTTRFSGQLTGNCEVELAVSGGLGDGSGRAKLKVLKRHTIRLPAQGATRDFQLDVATPTSPVYWWQLEAMNKGRCK